MTTLNDYYISQGKTLPSVADRTPVATSAGIQNYSGTAEQNNQLLGYLQTLPNSGNGVITGDNLGGATKINPIDKPVDTSHTGLISTLDTLTNDIKTQTTADQAKYDTASASYAKALADFGNTGDYTAKVLADNGVNDLKKTSDSLTSQIEAEQKATADRIQEIKNTFGGSVGGANAEIARIKNESANRIANLGIGLSAVNRQYTTAYNIASQLVTANTDKLKAQLESSKFVLDQLGTKLAQEKSSSLTLQLKQIDNQATLLKDAIKTGTDGLANGSIDPSIGTKALQDLTAGKISLSDFYGQIGTDTTNISTGSNINGYDITSYATDPKHEQNVLSIYNTLGDINNVADANAQIKLLSPSSPITGQMIIDSASKYGVDPKLMLALMQQDSQLGTQGLAVKTKNAGNVGNTDSGATQTFKSWADGVDAVASWLKKHPATDTKGTDYNQVGLLANTTYNPKSQADKDAKFYLDQYLKTGKQPTYRDVFGYRKDGQISVAQQRADDLYYEATGSSLPDANVLKTNKALIADNNKVLNRNEIASNTIISNFDLAIKGEITNNVNQNATIVNKLLNPFYLALGNPAVNQAMVSNGTISQEFANLISIRNASGTTVSDKEVASELLKFGTSVQAQKAVVERLKAEALNIHDALLNQNKKLYEVIDPLQTNPENPNRKIVATTEGQATNVLTAYKQAHPDSSAKIKSQITTAEKALGRPLTALEFLQAHPEYNQ